MQYSRIVVYGGGYGRSKAEKHTEIVRYRKPKITERLAHSQIRHIEHEYGKSNTGKRYNN